MEQRETELDGNWMVERTRTEIEEEETLREEDRNKMGENVKKKKIRIGNIEKRMPNIYSARFHCTVPTNGALSRT
jgi:hypothetical protein